MQGLHYIDYSRPPFIDISLPPAIVIPSLQLVTLYCIVLGIDFYLLRHEGHFNSVISPKQLRISMALIHTVIPMIFISKHPPFNILFAAVPWFMASYSAHMPTDQLTIKKYIHTLFKVTINDDDEEALSHKTRRIRCKGVAKFSLGLFKFAFMRLFINPLLPHHAEYALDYAWFSPMSLIYTVLFGVKAYCMLGFVDLVMGIEMAVFAWNMVDLFNSPIIASSPRDFWSRRWNKIVRNLLHAQVFTANTKREQKKIKSNDDINMPTTISSTKPKAAVIVKEPIKKRSAGKSKSTNSTANTASTNNVTKRVTRSSAATAAAVAAAEVASPITTDDDTTHATTDEEEEVESTTASSDHEVNDIAQQHDVIVTQPHKPKNKISPSRMSFWSTRQGRGLLSFIISGIFHELIIMSACRKITLENLAFFTLQGVACMIEVELRQGALKQEPQGKTRILCVALQVLFMAMTGRLFTGPFLRSPFFQEVA